VTEPPGKAASLAYLLSRLELVADRVRSAVARQQAVDPDPLDRFRGLHISAAQVESILSSKPTRPHSDDAHAARRAQVELEADEAEGAGSELRLRSLARAFGLDDLDIELLLIALAPDLDSRFERLYGYLHDDVTRRRASIGLWLQLCGLEPASGLAWKRLGADGPLTAAASSWWRTMSVLSSRGRSESPTASRRSC